MNYDFKGEMIRIRNTRVYGLNESIIASGYPKKVETLTPKEFEEMVWFLEDIAGDDDKNFQRAESLGEAPQGSGHDCYLKGIIVQADFTFPQYIWQQAKRYHWFDFVSSQSTMHKIVEMDVKESCNKYVDPQIIRILQDYIEAYNKEHDPDIKEELFHYIIANIPSGFMLTARITTNYLQLKTMYNQRKTHKMKDWREFKKWCEGLPHFLNFTQKVGK